MPPRASRPVLLMFLFAALCATEALAQRSGLPAAKKNPVAGKVAVKPKSLKFGKVTHIATLQLVIANSGTAPITGTITGNGTKPFTIISGSPAFGPLEPGGTYAVTVQFAPSKKGSYASALTIASDAKNAKVKVVVSGSAESVATPTPTVSPTPTPSPTATPSPSFTPTPISTPSLALAGSVSGPDPIAGAQVTAWAIGTTGYGQGATALACFTSDVNGNYAFGTSPGCGGAPPTGFVCSTPGQKIYLIATGGTTGSQTAANPQIGLMAMAGPCSIISASGAFAINELSTITSAYALTQFTGTASPYAIGAPPSNAAGLGNALATFTNLIDPATGTLPGPNLPAGASVPIAKIDTLAAALAACINSPGSILGSPSSCAELMCDALPGGAYSAANGSCTAPSGATAPADTLGAVIEIASNPGTVNVADLCSLASSEASAFAPVITCNAVASPPVPTDWTIALSFTAGGLDGPSAIAIDQPGDVWIANSHSPGGTGSVTEYNPAGALVSPAEGFSDPGFDYPAAIAIDPGGNVWVANAGGNSLSEMDSAGEPFSPDAYIGGGLAGPAGIAFDSAGDAWVANNTANGSVSEFSSSGSPLSPSAGYVGSGLAAPRGLAIDEADYVWVINTPISGNTANLSDLALLNTNGTIESPSNGYSGGGILASAALALNSAGDVWVSNRFGGSSRAGSISEFSPGGIALSPANGYGGGGLLGPTGIALDGSDHVWTVNNLGNSLSELNPSGFAISPGTGYTSGLSGPVGLALDSAGNVWVINNSGNTVSEFIGIAAPVVTPLHGLPQKP